MKLTVYSPPDSDFKRLWLAAVPFPKDGDEDVVSVCLTKDQNILARLKMLYSATLNGTKLRKEIVNYLGDGISELKKGNHRLPFFVDEEFVYKGNSLKIIVILSYFIKRVDKTPPIEIKTAQEQRDKYLKAKKDGILQIKSE